VGWATVEVAVEAGVESGAAAGGTRLLTSPPLGNQRDPKPVLSKTVIIVVERLLGRELRRRVRPLDQTLLHRSISGGPAMLEHPLWHLQLLQIIRK
jgi:hypothetical protein